MHVVFFVVFYVTLAGELSGERDQEARFGSSKLEEQVKRAFPEYAGVASQISSKKEVDVKR